MTNNMRDATNSFKGYEFQYYYFIKLIFKEYNKINIEFEGLEDIDIIYKGQNKKLKNHLIKIRII